MKSACLKQKGIAILAALFLVSIAAVLITIILTSQQITVKRTEQLLIADQAYLDAQGVRQWAIGVLSQKFDSNNSASLTDWPKILPPTAYEGAMVSGILEDYQARFNINNLIKTGENSADSLATFTRVVTYCSPATTTEQATKLANTLSNFISAGYNSNQIDATYLQTNPPFRVAHRPMITLTEARLAIEMTPQTFTSLEPYLNALPPGTGININTVPLCVLMSLAPSISSSQAQQIIEARKTQNNWQSTLPPEIASKTVQTSDFYLLRADVYLDKQHLVLYSLLHRKTDTDQNQDSVNIIWESIGTI